MLGRASQQCEHLRSILRRGDSHFRNCEHVCDVVQSHVSWSIFADQACAVHSEYNGKMLYRNIVNHVVVRALKECRIDNAEWMNTLCCHSRCERDRMSLRDSYIEESIRMSGCENRSA